MAAPIKAPEKLGKYRIEGVLGQGAMGVVYKGYDAAIERFVALKTVRAELLSCTDRAAWLARFQQEARAVGRCLHPNIVAVFDYGEDNGTPYLALEYVKGQELKKALRRQVVFPPTTVLYIVTQVLAALDYAHRHGVIHRDIKPANIIILDDGTIKVTDFGVARLDTSQLTQTGMMVGTPSYMAPEQFRGEPVSHLADIYASGALFYELLVGQPPFAGSNSSEVMYNVLHREPNYQLPGKRIAPALRAVIDKAMAKEPAARFQSAREFATTLQRLAQQLSETRSAPLSDASELTALMPTLAPTVLTTRPGDSFDEQALARLERELTAYLGPIAKVLIKKRLAQAASLSELCRELAEHIPSSEERSAFLQAVASNHWC